MPHSTHTRVRWTGALDLPKRRFKRVTITSNVDTLDGGNWFDGWFKEWGRVHEGRVHEGRVHEGRVHEGRVHEGRVHGRVQEKTGTRPLLVNDWRSVHVQVWAG